MRNLIFTAIIFCISFFITIGQTSKFYHLVDYSLKNQSLCEGQIVESLMPFLKSKNSYLEIRFSDNSSSIEESKEICSKIKNPIIKCLDKNICCKEASMNRIEKILKQNSMYECLVLFNSNKEYINYYNISAKTQSYSSLEDLNQKVKYFRKTNKKRNVCIVIHEGVTEFSCYPEIVFENPKIVTSEKEILITPNVNFKGGSYVWSNGSKDEFLKITPTKNTSFSVKYNLNGCLSNEAKVDVLISDCIDKINFRFDLKNKLMYEEYRGTYFIYPPNKDLDKDFISKRLVEDPNYYLIIDSICTANEIKIELFTTQNTLVKSINSKLLDLTNSRDMPKINGKIVLKIPSNIFNEESRDSKELEYSKEYKLRLTVYDDKNQMLDLSNYIKVLFVKCPYFDDEN
jgi:hypothetical protein